MNEKQKSITTRGINKVLKFLPIFEQKGYRFSEWVYPSPSEDGTIFSPFLEYRKEVNEFITILHEEEFTTPFDWGNWQDQADFEPHVLKKANLETLQKLLTIHIRKERFCDGHLATVLENGHIIAILRRLKEICNEMENGVDVKSR